MSALAKLFPNATPLPWVEFGRPIKSGPVFVCGIFGPSRNPSDGISVAASPEATAIDNRAAIIHAVSTYDAREAEIATLTLQRDDATRIHGKWTRYAAFVLTGDENADLQMAADEAKAEIDRLHEALREAASLCKYMVGTESAAKAEAARILAKIESVLAVKS